MLPKRQLGWIGVDLGTHAVKLAQTQRIGTRLRLVQTAVVPRARAGKSLEEWGSEDLRSALSWGHGFHGRKAACVAPVEAADAQSLAIPPGSVAERRAMIAGELGTIFGGQRREFDFWESPADAVPLARDNVQAISIAYDTASEIAACLTAAGLRCEVLDGLPLAITRAVHFVERAPQTAPVAALDWGFASATLCIVAQGRPLFTRHLRDCGCGGLIDRVAAALGLSAAEARQVLLTHGLPNPQRAEPQLLEVQEALAEVAADTLNGMAEELTKTLSYLEIHRAKLSPQRVWLLGGGGTVRNISAWLSRRIGLPVQGWQPLDFSGGPHEASQPLSLFGVAVALSALAWMKD